MDIQILFAIRPWDSEQNMDILMNAILNIPISGVKWGAYTTETIGFEIRELLLTASLSNDISSDDVIKELINLDDLISQVSIRLYNQI